MPSHLFRIVLATLLAGWCASSADATAIYAWATRTATFIGTSTAEAPVALVNNGTTTLKFSTTKANEVVKIVYNAECVVAGARGNTLHLRILVDTVEAQPNGNDFIFCSALDTNGKSWAPAVRQSVLKVAKAGVHQVKVLAHLARAGGGASGTWALDDSSLVVSGSILARAFRTQPRSGTDGGVNPLPLNDSGATVIKLPTTTADERVALTYNAECEINSNMSGRDYFIIPAISGAQKPDNSYKFLCQSFDSTGETWAGDARQTVIDLPSAGNHDVSVTGGPNLTSSTWSIDDSSLVIEKGVRAYAHRDDASEGSSTSEVQVALRNDGSTLLHFKTSAAKQVVRIVYGATCAISDGTAGIKASVRVVVDGVEAQPASGSDFAFCTTRPGGVLNYTPGYRQSVAVVPSKGDHTVAVYLNGTGASYSAVSDTTLLVE